MGRHRGVSLGQVIGLLDRIGGKAGLEMISHSSRPAEAGLGGPKYGDLTLGEIEAVFNLLVQAGGLGVLEKMRKGKAIVQFEAVEDGVQKKIARLYDRFGRVIAPKSFSGRRPFAVDRSFKLTLSDARKWGTFDLATLNLADRFDRIRPFVPAYCGVTLPTREEIIQSLIHCEAIRTRLRNDEASGNILCGAHLPTILPKCEVANHGALVEILLRIVKRSYEAQFSERKFQNILEGGLVGNVRIVSESRFREIRNRMATECVSGLTFFTPFQGFSIPASREMISLLPEECALSCFDTIMGWALYPDILLSNYLTPGYDLTGLLWDSSSGSLCGKADDGSAGFGSRGLNASGSFSAGVFLSR